MKNRQMVITRIPAIKTSTYAASVVALVCIANELSLTAKRLADGSSILQHVGTTLLGACMVGVVTWMFLAVACALYNALSKKFGGIHFIVSMDAEDVEQ